MKKGSREEAEGWIKQAVADFGDKNGRESGI